MILYVLRYPNPEGTPGDLIINREVFCHTLEDIVRPLGFDKVPGQTAIPASRYPLVLSLSNRFRNPDGTKKLMPEILDVGGFHGVRLHGGNTTEDTEGCILCAYKVVGQNSIQGRATDDLIKMLLANKEQHWIEFFTAYPYSGL